jgi:TatD DNase family protein
MNTFIDTHSHLYLEQFDEDRSDVVDRAVEAGVRRILLPNIEKATYDAMMAMTIQYPDTCFSMIGLHPCSVKENFEAELNFVERELGTEQHIAIGEIGLDYYWDTSFIKEQEIAFRLQLNWAKETGLPVAIHCRDSMSDILKFIREEQDGRLRGVLHCFTGTVDEGKELIDIGLHLGLGGVITFKNGGMDKVIPHLPLDKMILETDAPYLTPVPFRGKRNESAYIPYIADRLAEFLEMPVEGVAVATTMNARALFNI